MVATSAFSKVMAEDGQADAKPELGAPYKITFAKVAVAIDGAPASTGKVAAILLHPKLGHRDRAGYDCNCPHPSRHCHRHCVRVGCATRNSECSKFANTDVIENSFDNARPIGQFSIGLQTRSANARSVG